jgi:hypothetical protein
MPKMSVKKQNDKTSLTHVKSRKVNVVGNLEGKVLQSPLNDQEAYKNVDSELVRVPMPQDGTVPTWRVGNGKIFPMTKVKNEEGEWEYKPRAKKGPKKGAKYGKGSPAKAEKEEEKKGQATAAATRGMEQDMLEVLTTADAVDFQALVHAWQMRSIGALNDSEVQLIKKTIFEKRQDVSAVQAAPMTLSVPQVAQGSQMTF